MANSSHETPRVSVVMPTYNRSAWLRRAMASVLAQTFHDFEFIIVDDCSADDTEKVVADFADERVRYVRLSINTGGCALPRNIGFELARGEYLASLDDDYTWEKDKLERQVSFLDAHPDHVLVGTNARMVDTTGKEVGRIEYPEEDEAVRPQMLPRGFLVQGSVLFRKSAVNASGGFAWCDRRVYAEDYERWLRLGTAGRLANLPTFSVSFTTLEGVSSGHRFAWCLANLRTARKYRRYYPHGNEAIALRYLNLANVLLQVITDAPPLGGLKRVLKWRWPAGWRVVASVYTAAFAVCGILARRAAAFTERLARGRIDNP